MRIVFTADDQTFDPHFKEAVYIKGEDGKNLEFLWNGTKLGVRQEGQTEYQFVELKGATGEQGETGNGIDHITLNADYTLTVYYTDGTSYTTDSIRGERGEQGEKGDPGEQGEKGDPGEQGERGIPGVYVGTEEPTDDSTVWVDPSGDETPIVTSFNGETGDIEIGLKDIPEDTGHRTVSDEEKTEWSKVNDIDSKISPQATSANKLVSASEMGDAIASVEAKQLYSSASQAQFATKAALLAATTFYNADGTVATPTKNDVAYVLADESHNGKPAKYVIASDPNPSIAWGFVITYSDTTFTQAQMDAINSNITDEKRQGYDEHIENKENPHEVTKDQVGLGNVDNTSDNTKKANFKGSIAKDNTGFVTGGDVHDALAEKIDKNMTASASTTAAGTPATASYDPVQNRMTFTIPKGDTGDNGTDGKTAYQSAIDGGYTGTELQFNSDLANVSRPGHIINYAILTAASWVADGDEYTQTVNADYISTDYDYVVDAPSTYEATYGYNGIKAVSMANGSMVFTARSLPTVDIQIRITEWR